MEVIYKAQGGEIFSRKEGKLADRSNQPVLDTNPWQLLAVFASGQSRLGVFGGKPGWTVQVPGMNGPNTAGVMGAEGPLPRSPLVFGPFMPGTCSSQSGSEGLSDRDWPDCRYYYTSSLSSDNV